MAIRNKYIQQLIQDFNEAEKNPVLEPDFGESYEDFEKAMLEFEEASKEDSKNIVGISYEELPPAERMTVAQTQELTIAMLNALSAKGTNVHFPGDGIPAKLAYAELREIFKEGFHREDVPFLILGFVFIFKIKEVYNGIKIS